MKAVAKLTAADSGQPPAQNARRDARRRITAFFAKHLKQ
jgi:hypothetical protein